MLNRYLRLSVAVGAAWLLLAAIGTPVSGTSRTQGAAENGRHEREAAYVTQDNFQNLGPAVPGLNLEQGAIIDNTLFMPTHGIAPARLIEFSLAEQRVVQTHQIPSQGVYWYGVAAVGSKLYLGSTEGGQVVFDVASDAFSAARDWPAWIWEVDASPDGHLFAGTTTTGTVYDYDPATDSMTQYRFNDVPGNDVRAVLATTDTIYAGTGRFEADLVAIDRSTGVAQSILPASLEQDTWVYRSALSDDYLAVGTIGSPAHVAILDADTYEPVATLEPRPDARAYEALRFDKSGTTLYFVENGESGTVFAYDIVAGTLTELGDPVPPVTTTEIFARDNGDLVGLNFVGFLWTYTRETGQFDVVDLIDQGVPAGGSVVFSLVATDSRVYAAGTGVVQSFAIEDGQPLERLLVSGEAKSMTTVREGARPKGQETVYFALYPSAQLVRYEPGMDGPERLTSWDLVQNRPRDVHATGEDTILVATHSDSQPGGGLVVYDIDEDETTVYTNPLGPERVTAVTSVDEIAYVGGAAGGGRVGRLVAIDPETGENLWEVPLPRPVALEGLAAADEFVYGVTSGGHFFVVDTEKRRIVHQEEIADSGSPGQVMVSDDMIYVRTSNAILEVDPLTFEVRTVVQAGGVPILAADDKRNLFWVTLARDLWKGVLSDRNAAGK